MGFDVTFGNFTGLAEWPAFVQISFNRFLSFTIPDVATVVDMPSSQNNGGLDPSPNSGVTTITPEMFWAGSFGFPIVAGRFEILDRLPFTANNISSAAATLSINDFSATLQHVVSTSTHIDEDFVEPEIPPGSSGLYGSEATSENGSFWVGYTETHSTPDTFRFSLALFGLRWNEDHWALDALGGGGGFEFDAENNHSGAQQVIVDATALVKAYLNNKDLYVAFAWVVTPATETEFVGRHASADDIAAAIWAMWAKGDLAWIKLGTSIDHPGNPSFPVTALVGTVDTFEIEYSTASITNIHIELGGEFALPATCRTGPYPPAMTAL